MSRLDAASTSRSSAVRFALLLLCGWLLVATPGAAASFGFENVAARAAELSRSPYRPPVNGTQPLADIDYDAYRDIRFKPARALWRDAGLPFELMFFHAGHGFTQPVRVHEIDRGSVRPIAVPREHFDYGRNAATAPSGGAAELAGFRVHYPLNNPGYKDEVIVFLGASYFRAVGAGQHYGLSARGLAVDTVGGQSEEFPAFEAFWIERPAPDARELVVHALLNGPRVAGAYRFVVRPGAATVVDVQARLFLRTPVATLGLAPLTSMFFYGENQPRNGDFRPEVHDSDGLLVESGAGEWLWRPLVNPAGIFVTSFATHSPRGFGLLQRDRAFASYEDTEARYDRRPSVWITPKGDWGAGRIELLQYRTPDETHDNIGAYWVPVSLPAPGKPLDFAYEMRWHGDGEQRSPGGWTLQSRRGHGWGASREGELQFQIDFTGPALRALPADAAIEAVVTSSDDNARVQFAQAYRHPVNPGVRVTLKVERRSAAQPIELRMFLRHQNQVLSETWSYAVPPE